MRKSISVRLAANCILGLLSVAVIFHVLILIGAIPYEIVWGGRLKSSSQMYSFEITSLALNLLMLSVVSVHTGYIKTRIDRRIARFGLWAMFVLFLLNSIGNLLSVNEIEKLIFTPVTILLALFSLRLAMAKD